MLEMKYLYRIAGLVLLLVPVHRSAAQGCSDAGVCTVAPMRPATVRSWQKDAPPNRVRVASAFGRADHDIGIRTAEIGYGRRLDASLDLDLRLTWISQSGDVARVTGLSDIFAVITYKGFTDAFFSAGVKVPLSDGNRIANGRPLPMDYQSSLGTTDLLLAAGYIFKNLHLGLALQQPIVQNSNTFLSTVYPTDEKLSEFQSTNRYKRRGDLLLRVAYPLAITDRLTLTPGILPIYHLGEDSYTSRTGETRSIEGSSGLTVNGNFFLSYDFPAAGSLELSAGAPLVNREARPDGLTRSFMIGLEYRIAF